MNPKAQMIATPGYVKVANKTRRSQEKNAWKRDQGVR